jgi:hypothetical protein
MPVVSPGDAVLGQILVPPARAAGTTPTTSGLARRHPIVQASLTLGAFGIGEITGCSLRLFAALGDGLETPTPSPDSTGRSTVQPEPFSRVAT